MRLSSLRLGTLAAGLMKLAAAAALLSDNPLLRELFPPRIAGAVLIIGTIYQTIAKPVVRDASPSMERR
jgi:hypothetical protein